ncbi:MAG: class I SAM-dependent methyltransferase [Acidobacteria bacterium]|nr:class I SAM-dependent methyltransferase [Acidobacteriota bacterium]
MGRRYIPALGYDWLTRFYDPLVRRTIHESGFQRRLVEQSGISPKHRVLDLGCGTASLALLIRQMHPQTLVVGLDGDPRVLHIAKGKTQRIGADLALHCAMAFQLPYANGSFDRVLSSLLFHHLGAEEKRKTLSEVWRVLRPGGELHFADWGKAEDWRMRTAFLLVQFLDGFKSTPENVRGALPKLLSQAGFVNVRETERLRTIFGNLALVRARKAPANF